jgi:FeS assembly SUF system protein
MEILKDINEIILDSMNTQSSISEILPNLTNEMIIAACQTVYDPEIPVNVYDLGLIYGIDIFEGNRVHVDMTLTAPACPSAQELPIMVKEAIMEVNGVAFCDVSIVWDPPWNPVFMTEEARLSLNLF